MHRYTDVYKYLGLQLVDAGSTLGPYHNRCFYLALACAMLRDSLNGMHTPSLDRGLLCRLWVRNRALEIWRVFRDEVQTSRDPATRASLNNHNAQVYGDIMGYVLNTPEFCTLAVAIFQPEVVEIYIGKRYDQLSPAASQRNTCCIHYTQNHWMALCKKEPGRHGVAALVKALDKARLPYLKITEGPV